MNIKEAICLCRSTSRLNRRFIALIAMIVLSCQYMQALDTGSRQYEPEGKKENTDPLSAFYSHGLPHDAYPAAYNGSDIPYAQLSPKKKQDYLAMSCLQSGSGAFGTYYFFTQPITNSDGDSDETYYNIYMFDNSSKVLTKIFSHHVDTYTKMQIDNISWDYDIKTFNKPYISKSGAKGMLRIKKATPVVVLSCTDRGITPHASPLTVIINPTAHKHKVLTEKFLGFVSIDDNTLMVAEQGLTKRIILTTSTVAVNKDLPTPKGADIFYRTYLTPSINIYSTTGVKIGSNSLPTDEVDCLR